MNKFVTALVIGLGVSIVACGPTPLLPSAPIPTLPPLPSLVPPALTPVATAVPPAAPTSTVAASPTVSAANAVSQTLIARTTVTTTGPTTTRPAAPAGPTVTLAPTSPAAGAPPGVYITDLKVEPNPPTRTSDLIFSPTFVNSMNAPQNYRWIVYIFKTENPSRSTGETPPAQSTIPVGVTDQRAGGTWKYGPGSQCDFFFVRVGSLDQDRKTILFTKPDGKVFEKNLTLCP